MRGNCQTFGLSFAGLLLACCMVVPDGHAAATNEASLPIDLPTALKLAGAQNLDVAIARERVREAQALHDQARMQFLPWLTPGVGYRRHAGNIQDVGGTIFETTKQSYTAGAALTAQLDLGEAIYKSLATRKLAQASAAGAEATQQETLFNAAAGYFALAGAAGASGAAEEAVRISVNYAAEVKVAVEAGIAFKGDLYRIEVQAEKSRLLLRQAEEHRRQAAARLAQTLRLQPATDLLPLEAELAPLTLVATNAALDSLVARALASRPELRQSTFLVGSAESTRKGATRGPLIPTLGAQAYLGGLGGGKNNTWGNFDDTQDYFLGLSWRIGPGGLFDRSRVRLTEARHQASLLELEKEQQDVQRQVVESFTRVHSLRDQLVIAQRSLAAATELMTLTFDRKEFGVGAVLETIQAEQDLTRARLDYLAILTEHNTAQFALQRATGSSSEVP